jgi:hypothetical protein
MTQIDGSVALSELFFMHGLIRINDNEPAAACIKSLCSHEIKGGGYEND